MAVRSSAPFPLNSGPIELSTKETDLLTGVSKIVVPQCVNASEVPTWLAEIAHARFLRLNQVSVAHYPTLDEIRRLHGGFVPLAFLDLLAAGNGEGRKWMWLEERRSALVDQCLIEVPAFEHPVCLSVAPFPVQGSRVDDGTGMEAGSIPEWFAALLVRRKNRWRRGDATAETMDEVRRRGGLTPLEVLDLAIGGRGDGLSHRIVSKHWSDAAELTDIEAGILEDAEAAPERSILAHGA